MTKQIDFTKPLEIVDMQGNIVDYCKVIQVIPWSYFNDAFQHAVVVTAGTSIDLYAVSNDGEFEAKRDSVFHNLYKIQNKKEVTSETWVNLYKDGFTGCEMPSKNEADSQKRYGEENRFAYFVTKHYSDGTTTNEIIPISE